MQFSEHKAIFLQIADVIRDQIALGILQDEERIASVRDMAMQLEVNPNTVVRSYNLLQEEGVLINQRGIGYFIAPGALENVLAKRRANFTSNQLPKLFETMESLGISVEELKTMYEEHQRNGNENK